MLENYKGVMIIAEQRDGNLQTVALELVGKAKDLAAKRNTTVTALVVGDKVSHLAENLAQHGADKVILVEDERLKHYMTEPYVKAIYDVIEEEKPEIVLFGATSIGRDLAPRVSARVHTGLTADCTGLDIDEATGNLLMTRPAFGGNIMATIICENHRPQMSTVRPGVMQKLPEDKSLPVNVEKFDVKFEDKDFNVEILEETVATKKLVKIEDAKILVSAGRGFGGPNTSRKPKNSQESSKQPYPAPVRQLMQAGLQKRDKSDRPVRPFAPISTLHSVSPEPSSTLQVWKNPTTSSPSTRTPTRRSSRPQTSAL